MFRRTLATATLALALLWAGPAMAQSVTIDPDAGGIADPILVEALDWNVGNAVAVDFFVDFTQLGDADYVASITGADDAFQVYYQANLSNFNIDSSSDTFPNDGSSITPTAVASGDDSWTLVLGFGEYLNVIVPTGADSAILSFNFADQTNFDNFFQIYANDVPGDDLSGACFVCGTLIMEGFFVADTFASNFSVTDTDPTGVPLDQAPAGDDDYSGVTTISGSGSVTLKAVITGYDSSYFTDPLQLITFALAPGTGTALPFSTVDPAACFFAVTSTGGLTPTCTSSGSFVTGSLIGVGDVDPLNGISGPNTMFQADASTTFIVEQQEVIPEPATLTLFGLGLAGAAAARRRQQRKAKGVPAGVPTEPAK